MTRAILVTHSDSGYFGDAQWLGLFWWRTVTRAILVTHSDSGCFGDAQWLGLFWWRTVTRAIWPRMVDVYWIMNSKGCGRKRSWSRYHDVHLNGLRKTTETSGRLILELSFELATFRLKLTGVIVWVIVFGFRRVRVTERWLLASSFLVCPSAWNNSAPSGRIFMKFVVCVFFENL